MLGLTYQGDDGGQGLGSSPTASITESQGSIDVGGAVAGTPAQRTAASAPSSFLVGVGHSLLWWVVVIVGIFLLGYLIGEEEEKKAE